MNSRGDTFHGPWPIHTKKHAKNVRKSRRQSKEFEKLQKYGAEGANTVLNTDNVAESMDLTTEKDSAHMHKRRRRSSARRGSIFDPSLMENIARRRQSLLPVLRAASKGEEVEVIEGITSGASIGPTASSSSVSQTIQDFSRSSIAAVEMRKERAGSAAQEEWLSSYANMKRRRTSSFVKEGVASEISQQLSKSGKLEDQINLQHLVELMRIFNVRPPYNGYISSALIEFSKIMCWGFLL